MNKMTAEEKIRKWPFDRIDRFEEDIEGNKIFTVVLLQYVVKKDIDGKKTLTHKIFDEFLYKIEMKNGDLIKF